MSKPEQQRSNIWREFCCNVMGLCFGVCLRAKLIGCRPGAICFEFIAVWRHAVKSAAAGSSLGFLASNTRFRKRLGFCGKRVVDQLQNNGFRCLARIR